MRKTILIIITSLSYTLVQAQISLDEYCDMVIGYNIALQQAELDIERTAAEWQRAKKGHLPLLNMGRQATFDFAQKSKGKNEDRSSFSFGVCCFWRLQDRQHGCQLQL